MHTFVLIMKRITSILLAIFFLMSSSHLSFATHYCGGHAFKHALLINANDFGCGMEDDVVTNETNCNFKKKCCDNQLVNLSIKDNFQASSAKINFEQQFILANITQILFSLPIISKNVTLFKDYKPPLPDKDISVLFQTFLI